MITAEDEEQLFNDPALVVRRRKVGEEPWSGRGTVEGKVMTSSVRVNQQRLVLRSPAGHPAEDWGQRSYSLPGESGAGLSSTVQPHHWEGA